jgi:hypothetical protein
VRLRLAPRRKLERVVEIRTVEDLIAAFEKRIADGFQYGDFQFSIEHASEDFLHRGVFSCYRPVPMDTPIPPAEKQLTDENWRQLLYLAHTDEKQAFDRYADYYVSTNGQMYWSDLHQLSIYPDNYHREIDAKLCAPYPATEMITEINVPRPLHHSNGRNCYQLTRPVSPRTRDVPFSPLQVRRTSSSNCSCRARTQGL